MSYIVAFVQFSTRGEHYPVECFRTDIAVGDPVIVQMPNRPPTQATVTAIRYLNWKCAGSIKGKQAEAVLSEDGKWSTVHCPSVVGFATNDAFVAEIVRRGWIPMEPGHGYLAALTNSNKTQSANILVRRNGIELQIIPARRTELPDYYSLGQESITTGRVVKHFLSHTNFNLYEGILRFEASFMSDLNSYERFFTSVGSSDRRTEKLKEDSEKRKKPRDVSEENPLRDYYMMASDGSGNPVYAGDGMWIDGSGRLKDWGH